MTRLQVIVSNASTASNLPFLLAGGFPHAFQVGPEGLIEGREVKVLRRQLELSGTANNAN